MKNKNQLDIDVINKNIRNDILNFKPKHELGQNFIFDEMILSNIAEVCCPVENQSILEIGSGPGVLSQEVLKLKPELEFTLIDKPFAKDYFEKHNFKGKFIVKDLLLLQAPMWCLFFVRLVCLTVWFED